MDKNDFKKLDTGDIVRGKYSIKSFVVMSNNGDTITIARTETMTNPEEWDLIFKANLKRVDNQ